MLIHIRPRLFYPGRDAQIVDLAIEPLDIYLRGDIDLVVRKPYPNKCFKVACRKQGRQKAVDGIFIETKGYVDKFRLETRWAIEERLLVRHIVLYTVLDREFEAVSDDSVIWYGSEGEFGDWSCRRPQLIGDTSPFKLDPMMEVELPSQRQCGDIHMSGKLVYRIEHMDLPTLERERVLKTKLNDRMPAIESAFQSAFADSESIKPPEYDDVPF